jgi:hypothetical protein
MFWLKNLKERDHLESLSINGKRILEWVLGKYTGKMWSGFVLIWIGPSDGLL